ncbi:MAG TPA: glycosyltransferase family 39 protein [bacterium]|nr:glycosyltransferase family 39 protein [bacterium]HOL47742.1 glycosyltransferase family 39 protein [bacterium]HPQ18024.1 glycosyltransferase family 39 protein [bacterium]
MITNYFKSFLVVLLLVWIYFIFYYFIDTQLVVFNSIYFKLFFIKIFFGSIEKFFLNIIIFFSFIIIIFSAFKIGKIIIKKLNIQLNFGEEISFSVGLGLSLFSYFSFFCGVVGLLSPLFFKIFFVILFFFSIIKIKINFSIFKILFSLFKKINLTQKIILISLLPIFILNFIMMQSPEIFYDSLVYHLAIPNYYILHNQIKPIEYLMHSNFPLFQQMINLLALLLNNELLAKMLHSSMFIFLLLNLFSICKKIFSLNIAILTIAIISSLPLLIFNSWTCGNDVSLTYYFSLYLSAALNYFVTKNNKYLFLAAFFAGLSFSIKYTAFFSLIGIIFVLIFFVLKINKNFKKNFFIIFIFLIIFILPIIPYLIKNFLFTGNPIYPFFYKFFNDEQLKIFEYSNQILPLSLNLFNFDFKKLFLYFWANTEKEAIGIIFLSFIPLIFFYFYKNKIILYLFIAFLISYFFWSFGVPQFRFLLPAFPIIAIIIAFSYDELLKKIQLFNLLLAILILLNFFFYNLTLISNIRIEEYFYFKKNKDEYLSFARALYPQPPYAAIKWCNQNLTKNSKILFIGENRTYYLKKKYISYSVETNRQPLIEYLQKAKNANEFLNILKLKEITHLLINYKEAIRNNPGYKTFYWNEQDREIFDEFWKKHIKLLYFKYGTYIYEIIYDKEITDNNSDNLLEVIEINGWNNYRLFDFFIKNNKYENIIDEYEQLNLGGTFFLPYINYYKKLIDETKQIK